MCEAASIKGEFGEAAVRLRLNGTGWSTLVKDQTVKVARERDFKETTYECGERAPLSAIPSLDVPYTHRHSLGVQKPRFLPDLRLSGEGDTLANVVVIPRLLGESRWHSRNDPRIIS
jgi:hypothetical protein